MLIQKQCQLDLASSGPGFTDISAHLQHWLDEISAGNGLLTAYIRHTSASLTIQENADPDVLRDLTDILSDLAPESSRYRHNSEGADDMPAHIKSMLTATTLSIPVQGGRPVFGTWQSLFLIEHRARAHQRQVILHYTGDLSTC